MRDSNRPALVLCLAATLAACGTAPAPSPFGLPPSASDLDLLGRTRLCDIQTDIVAHWQGAPYRSLPWGAGEQLHRPAHQAQSNHDRFYFFNVDRILVGAVFRFNAGLNLGPYPVLRDTLAALVPTSTFYLDPTQLLSKAGARAQSAVLYRTGDVSSTTHYLVLEHDDGLLLLAAAVMIDPYEQLLSGYREQFLPGLKRSRSAAPSAAQPGGNLDDDFPGRQQFARGEAALFGSCGAAHPDIAVNAYRQAIHHGLTDKIRFAEAHHRLGLALRDLGQLADAQQALEQAMSLHPHAPAIINSLGRVLAEQQQWRRAAALFEQAVVLRPNFAEARFNLAESLEHSNRRRAIAEYETYLALVEGLPGQKQRINLVKKRVQRLRGGP